MRSRDGGTRELPARAGIGLRAPHVAEIVRQRPAVGWLEVHAENYMGGGPAIRELERVREDFPISLHGVGLSLGTAGPLDARHLERLARLVERIEPALVSEHLSWSVAGGIYLNDLLPLPLTEETLAVVARHVDQVQARLGRRILVENPSSYLRFADSTIPEAVFLAEVARRTGCGVLCDVNNIYVSSMNLGFDAVRYLAALPAAAIGEIHLAGHAVNDADGCTILIDDHGAPIANAVWRLYTQALERFGPIPTLVEWDTNLPPLAVLLGEAAEAQELLNRVAGGAHVCAA
jgi:uncharacterized protein (UPF0276 family)